MNVDTLHPPLSVIIVNYNVKYFLDQCIASILKSHVNFEIEIIVVDNASNDRSEEYITKKYPQVTFVSLEENLGFSKANNIGVEKAKGEFILILNPDTIVQSDTLQVCFEQCKKLDTPGILGVKMIDGSGMFLPESKRGFPSPLVSFYRLFGLSRIFPRSAVFNHYYLGNLSRDENHEVDILTGAFMYLRKDLYERVGGFDEDYFMYGEDIDLSYTVQKAGYKNYYISDTNIIHFKGESTRKLSFNYVKRFYEAMMIFARKHTSASKIFAYALAIKSAIYLNAFLKFVINSIKRLVLPIVDLLIFLIAFYGAAKIWELIYYEQNYFSFEAMLPAVSLYLATSSIIFLLSGKYHREFKLWNTIKLYGYNFLALLILYSLLPESIRFSRVVLVIGALMGSGLVFFKDLLIDHFNRRKSNSINRILFVGETARADEMLELLDRRKKASFVGTVNPGSGGSDEGNYLGDLDSIESIVRFHGVNEIIFDQSSNDTLTIMEIMTHLDHTCEYRIYAQASGSLVGSYSPEFQGVIDTFEVEYEITSPYNKMMKRFIDVLLSTMTIVLFPILWPLNGLSSCFWKASMRTLVGQYTWVGYMPLNEQIKRLPVMKPAVFAHTDDWRNVHETQKKLHLNFIYAREYSVWLDIRTYFRNCTKIRKTKCI